MAALAVVAMFLVSPTTHGTDLHDHDHPQVLLVHSYHQGLPWTDSVHSGFTAGLGEQARHTSLFVEYLDALRTPITDSAVEMATVAHLVERYRNRAVDLLVATDDPAWRLLTKYRDRIAPGKPLLFAGANNLRIEHLAEFDRLIGVAETPDFPANLALMRTLHPAVQRLLVIGDDTPTFESNLAALRDANAAMSESFTIEPLAFRTLADLRSALAGQQGNYLAFLMGRPRDGRGNTVSGPEVAAEVRQATERPIYSGWSFFLGHGIVGGRLVSGEDQGTALAALVKSQLAGERAVTSPRVIESPNRDAFDHRELKRLGIDERKLPAGARIINRPPGIAETHPQLVTGAIALFILLLGMIGLQTAYSRRRRELSARLERELTLMQALMNAAPFPMFYKDAEMRYQRFNEAFLRFLGKTREELQGQSVGAAGQTTGQTGLFRSKDEELLRQGGQQIYETQVTAADGRRHDIVFHKAVVRLADGTNAGIVGAMLDVSELRSSEAALRDLNQSLEERVSERTAALTQANLKLQGAVDSLALAQDELVHSEKLASLGAMVAGVAHELNTPIGNGLTVATTLQDELAALHGEVSQGAVRRSQLDRFFGRGEAALEILVRNLQRAAQLIANFKEVAVDQTSDRRRQFRLIDVVRENVQAFEAGSASQPPHFVIDIDGSFELDSYPGALGQILLNLFENARLHAFADRDPGEIRIVARESGRGRIQLDISDNGCGIPAESLTRIFDPFYTTRMGQGGSGLGLAIVFRLVTQTLHGRVRVSSRVGDGTIFMIDIPCNPDSVAMEHDEAGTPAANPDIAAAPQLPGPPLHLRDELLEIRELIESHAASVAATNATEMDRYHLQHIFRKLDDAFAGHDLGAQIEADLAFHVAIIEATHDPALRKVGDAVIQLMYGHIRRNLDRLMPDPVSATRLREQHREMFAAIIARDAEAAGIAAAAHMAYVRAKARENSAPC